MELLSPVLWLKYARRNRLRILMYHSISDTPGDRLAVHPAMFAAQIQHLAERRYVVDSLEVACANLRAKRDLRKRIVLTFDDGYQDFLTTAAPILQRYGFHATLFVVTGQCWQERGEARPGSGPVRLTEEQVHLVKSMGYGLGSHTKTHPDLTTAKEAAVTRELVESRAMIEMWGESFFAFAYPGGRFTRRERDAVEHAGYGCALIVGGRWGNGPETDRFLLKREPVLASDTIERFAQRVYGYYEWHFLWARARGVSTR